MSIAKRGKTIRVALRRKKKEKNAKERQRFGGRHPHYNFDLP